MSKPPAAKAAARNRGRTQAERTALSHEKLLDAALLCFSERGFRGTTLAHIGERAGYSRAMVTLRFGSKEGLLRELATRMLQRWGTHELEPALATLRGVEALRTLLRLHREAVQKNREAMRALYTLMFESLHEMSDLRAAFVELDTGWRKTLERLTREAVRAGELPDAVDPRALATLLLGSLRGLMMQWLLAPEKVDLTRSYAELERTLLG
jgi:AcrR family transcriptional regulator